MRAVRLGRRIYDNLRKAMGYILAIHVPIAGLALLPVLFGWPLMLTPMLIALLELIIDPACSVVLEAEPEERDVMRRPPRDPHSHLLSRSLVSWSLLQGLIALGAVTALLVAALERGMVPDEAARFGLRDAGGPQHHADLRESHVFHVAGIRFCAVEPRSFRGPRHRRRCPCIDFRLAGGARLLQPRSIAR